MEAWLKHFTIVAAGFSLFFMLVFSFSSNPTGRVIDDNPLYYYISNPEKAADSYNENIGQVPGFIKTMFGNERINAALTLDNGSIESFGIITEKGKITHIQEGFIDNPSLFVKTDETVINGLIKSDNQLAYLRNAINTKAIEYRAVKIKTKVKIAAANFLLKAYSIFKK
jgi:hypothetical protein